MKEYGIAFAVALMGSILGFALLIMLPPVEKWVFDTLSGWGVWIVAFYHDIRERIEDARRTKLTPAEERRRRKLIDAGQESFDVLVPRSAGPLVESPVSKDPILLKQVPIRSTKADAKREAHRYAEKRAGRPLTWKQANRLLNAWGREERALEREMAPEYAERMQELTEASR